MFVYRRLTRISKLLFDKRVNKTFTVTKHSPVGVQFIDLKYGKHFIGAIHRENGGGIKASAKSTESCFRHPLFDVRGIRKVEIRHTNFHFSSKKVTSKSRKVEVFDLTIVKKLSTFRPKKSKCRKVEK